MRTLGLCPVELGRTVLLGRFARGGAHNLDVRLPREDLRSSAEALADDLARRAVVAGLGALGSDDELLERAVQTAAGRPELERVPPTPSPGEIRDLYQAVAGHADARLPA